MTFLLAYRADSEEIHSLVEDFEPGLFRKIFWQIMQRIHVRISNIVTLHADQMWMGMRISTVISAASMAKLKFRNLSDIFQKVYGFVNRRQAGGGKIGFDFLVNPFDAWMIFALREDPNHGIPLRGDAKTFFP